MNVLQVLMMQCCLEEKKKTQNKQKTLNQGRFLQWALFLEVKGFN